MMGMIKKLFGLGAETVEQAQDLSQQATLKTKEAVASGVAQVEDVVDASQEAVSSVSKKAGDVLDQVKEQVVAVLDDDLPTPPNKVVFIDRDDLSLPLSSSVSKAVELVRGQQGAAGVARGLRVYEYANASAKAFDLRVDHELLALGALFSGFGPNGGEQAYAFCIIQGMWEGLADKVKSAIENLDSGISSDDLETRALALGAKAEALGGQVPYINGATSAVTRKRHAA